MITKFSTTKKSRMCCVLLLLMMFLGACGRTDALEEIETKKKDQVVTSPKVIKTFPKLGAKNVDPSIKHITVTFDQDMQTDRMWSWCYEFKEKFPKLDHKSVKFINKRTCTANVKLEAGKSYVIWFNTEGSHNFRGMNKKVATPYRLEFRTAKKTSMDYQDSIDKLTKYLEADNPKIEKLKISHKLSESNQLTIYLHGNKELRDISAFKKITPKELPIRGIYLGDTSVTDISPLIHFDIKVMNIGKSAFNDFKQLRKFNCEKLLIYGLNVTNSDLKYINHMPLADLWINWNKAITDITHLSKLKLRELQMHQTKVTDITPLKAMPLQGLNLALTKVTDLSSLSRMSTLKRLTIAKLNVNGLKPLRELALEFLSTYCSPGIDLEPISHMPLKTLWIKGHYPVMPDFTGDTLREVRIRDANMTDVNGLKGLKNLESLWLHESKKLDDMSGLKKLSVKILFLESCNEDIDLSSLNKCTSLYKITLPSYIDVSPLRSHPTLKVIDYGFTFKPQRVDDFWKKYKKLK